MQVSKIELKTFQISGFKTLFNVLKNYTKRAYFVGGSVRDFFLFGGMSKPKDIDIEVYDINPEIFEKNYAWYRRKRRWKKFLCI